jgi:hypothetical protein
VTIYSRVPACLAAILLAAAAAAAGAVHARGPYAIAPGLFDTGKPDMGLAPMPGAETITVFRPGDGGDKFSNGVVLMPFKGRLYAQWQSSPKDEDTADTWVAYASSDDGVNWSAPEVLVAAGQGGRMHSSGGWWTDGKTLVTYINVWPTGFQSGEGGHAEYMTSRDGAHWAGPWRVRGKDGEPVEGIIEQDPHRMADGAVLTAFHLKPGLFVAPFHTRDRLGVRGWQRGEIRLLANDGKTSRELEPSIFLRGSGRRQCAIMVFRDQAESFYQLAAESCNGGKTWTEPQLTDMPDSRAKQSAGNLPDGTAYLVNAPGLSRVRIPLAITLSRDGRTFDRSFRLRGAEDLQPLRYEGRYKRPGYHYPKSVVWKDWLYVAYTTNKEDVQVTRVPLANLR